MTGELKDISFGRNGECFITLIVDTDYGAQFDELKDSKLDIEIKKHRKKRSANANAYFHVLVNKIAAKLGASDEETKRNLVLNYGAIATKEDGSKVGAMLPSDVNPLDFYPYVKCFDIRTINGNEFACYLFYKHTHTLNTEEMARLIDGTISEAQELGIETATPEEVARMKAQWSTGPKGEAL